MKDMRNKIMTRFRDTHDRSLSPVTPRVGSSKICRFSHRYLRYAVTLMMVVGVSIAKV